MVRSSTVRVLKSKFAYEIAKILKEEGFIEFIVTTESDSNYFLLGLKFKGLKRKPYITKIFRISSLGRRVYVRGNGIPKVLGGIGVAIRFL
jgi:small subunit ribosomal protein S8